MAIKAIGTFTKSDASTPSYSDSDINSQIETYFASGKITQKPVKEVSSSGLVETYTSIFKDQTSIDEFAASTDIIAKRELWLRDNNVGFEIKYVEE